MVLGVDLGVATVPWLAGGLLGVLTAAWVLRVNSKSLMNKALALYIGLQGALAFSFGLLNNTGSRTAPEAAVPVLTILSFMAAWAFWWIQRSWPLFTDNVLRRFQMLLLAGAIIAGFYLSNRHWWDDGPLRAAEGLLPISQGFIAYFFARHYHTLRTGPQRRSTLLFGVAFALPVMYLAFARIGLMLEQPVEGFYAQLANALAVSALVPVLATVSVLLAGWIRPRDGDMKGELSPALYAALLPVLGAAVLALVIVGQGQVAEAHAMLAGLWVAPHAMIGAFALTRLQVVDMADKLRRVVKQFIMAAIFFAIFFGVSEGLEGVIGNRFGSLAGLGAAALLTFALSPLQKLADRMAAVAMPKTVPIHERSAADRATYYREQVRLAWEDGELGRKERAYLNGLQRTLRLGADVVAPIEYEEAPEYAKPPKPVPGASRPGTLVRPPGGARPGGGS